MSPSQNQWIVCVQNFRVFTVWPDCNHNFGGVVGLQTKIWARQSVLSKSLTQGPVFCQDKIS